MRIDRDPQIQDNMSIADVKARCHYHLGRGFMMGGVVGVFAMAVLEILFT